MEGATNLIFLIYNCLGVFSHDLNLMQTTGHPADNLQSWFPLFEQKFGRCRGWLLQIFPDTAVINIYQYT